MECGEKVKRRIGLARRVLNILITLCRVSAGKTLKAVRNNEHPIHHSIYESFVRSASGKP
jgi:hypothetical protein